MLVNRLPLSFVFGVPLVIAACGGDGLTLPPEGEAAHITVVAGDSQSARVGSTLVTPLLVQVTDTRDRPVAGATVVFSFPSAAAGQAAPGSAITNADGQASSTLTLGSAPGTVTGTVAVPVDEGITPVEASFTATALPDGANGIASVSGEGQNGPVNTALPAPLVVQVTDRFGNPISGETISWSVTGGGSVSETSTVTDANGQASVTRTLGGTAGPQTTLATADGLAGSPVTFTHTATGADGIAPVSGEGQNGPVNSTLPAPLVVQVTDRFGNPIPGETVSWSVTGGGSVSAASTVTDANGQASVTRTLGGTAGPQTTLATADGLAGSPVTFTHTATAGSATGVVKVSGDNQSAQVGTELANPLVVQVLDAESNPIPNRAVTWVTGDGSVSPENTTTDAQGYASTRWTLGSTPGAKTANAVVSGVGTATFNATATAGAPSASNSTVSASPATITAGTGSSTITVTVRDASNNPISGVSVSVESSGTGNTINPGSASSGANGVATFTFSSTVAEAKTITATAGGVRIDDQATITVQKATSIIEITNDDPDPSVPSEAVTVEFSVRGAGVSPTGTVTVTVSEGPETCSTTVSSGSGSCVITFLTPGLQPNRRRILTASYSGDERFLGDTDTENHTVNPAPVSNNPPTAAFTPPSCTAGQPCQFTNESSDSDGVVTAWNWSFGDGQSSTLEDPSNTYAAAGTFTVTLTVTDDDGAPNTVMHDVTVAEAPPANTPPTATDDSYATPTDTPLNPPAGSLTANDSPPEAGDVYSTTLASSPTTPGGGQVSVGSDGSFSYTPASGFTGSDSFEYTLSDGRGGNDTATVTITVGP